MSLDTKPFITGTLFVISLFLTIFAFYERKMEAGSFLSVVDMGLALLALLFIKNKQNKESLPLKTQASSRNVSGYDFPAITTATPDETPESSYFCCYRN